MEISGWEGEAAENGDTNPKKNFLTINRACENVKRIHEKAWTHMIPLIPPSSRCLQDMFIQVYKSSPTSVKEELWSYAR